MPDHWEPLPKEEVIKAVERRYPARIPLENIAAFLGEALHYGTEHRRQFNSRKT